MSESALPLLGIVVAWLAAVIGAYAIVGDWVLQRFKHCRRCPKCWYDMSHSPSLTCSECGFTAKRERTLLKGRRRWKLLWLALIMLTGSHALRAIPAVRQRGWVAAVPTTALIISYPALRPDLAVVNRQLFARLWGRNSATSPGLPSGDWQTECFLEFAAERLQKRLLRPWQSAMFEGLCAIMSPGGDHSIWSSPLEQLLGTVTWSSGTKLQWNHQPPEEQNLDIMTRPVWPVGAPIYARVQSSRSRRCHLKWEATPESHGFKQISRELRATNGGCGRGSWRDSLWRDGLEEIGQASTAGPVVYSVSTRQGDVAVGLTSLGPMSPIRWFAHPDRELAVTTVSGAISDLLIPVECAEFATAVGSSVRASLSVENHGSCLFLRIDSNQFDRLLSALGDATFAVTAEISCGDRRIAMGEFWWSRRSPAQEVADIGGILVEAKSADGSTLRDPQPDGEWQLVLKGDPYVALRDFSATSYWSGEIELPLEVRIHN